MSILYTALSLGVLGAICGLLLTLAYKKLNVEADPRIEQITECLGGANCGACGYAGCEAFAQAILEGKADPALCVSAPDERLKEIGKIMGIDVAPTQKKVAVVLCHGCDGIAKPRYTYDGLKSCLLASSMAGGPKLCEFSCVGLGDCVKACPFGALSIEKGLAKVNNELCTGCGTCIPVCPRSILELMPYTKKAIVRCKNTNVARVARASCSSACIGCKKCERTCQHDAIHVINGVAVVDNDKCTGCGECVEGCPCNCIDMGPAD